jgi:hypothetical protein
LSQSVPEKPDILPDYKSGSVPSGNTIAAQRGVWMQDDQELILLLLDTGAHADLF